MISYSRTTHETIPASSVKIIGLGGAGANMLERIALDSMGGAELLALNTDIRTLDACLAKDKIQLGVNLTKGLGAGGDPELGQQAVFEAEAEIRTALKGQRIVFLCTGLGGGTGSGAAPIVARIAREEGAFVVVFATMPFFFEGRRRRDQAETALNQIAVLSNALVTFDNNRMGELVLAKQGIHEAFAAADRMISESIKAVIRLVVRPGLINVGLDDLMSALRTTRSRCLFGSGIADGKDRATKALRNALSSPLLDQGSLLKEAQTVLVHLSGGESLTLFEVELLMRGLQKHVPESAQVLFGAAIDPAMGDHLSITLISSLPEDALASGARDSLSFSEMTVEIPAEPKPKPEIVNPFTAIDAKAEPEEEPTPEPEEVPEEIPEEIPEEEPEEVLALQNIPEPAAEESEAPEPGKAPIPETRARVTLSIGSDLSSLFRDPEPVEETAPPEETEEAQDEERPFAEFVVSKPSTESAADAEEPDVEPSEETEPIWEAKPEPQPKLMTIRESPVRRIMKKPLWGKTVEPQIPQAAETEATSGEAPAAKSMPPVKSEPPVKSVVRTELKLDSKHASGQNELSFDSAPRGRFEGENPNVFEGEDLDLPPFLRKKKP